MDIEETHDRELSAQTLRVHELEDVLMDIEEHNQAALLAKDDKLRGLQAQLGVPQLAGHQSPDSAASSSSALQKLQSQLAEQQLQISQLNSARDGLAAELRHGCTLRAGPLRVRPKILRNA